MNKKARNATLFGLAAGIVLVPILRAVIRKYSNAGRASQTGTTAPPNHLFSAYLGRSRPHRRKAEHNGQHSQN